MGDRHPATHKSRRPEPAEGPGSSPDCVDAVPKPG